ncbi:MAG: ABC transporter permease [Prochloraceae cyanobacterium]
MGADLKENLNMALRTLTANKMRNCLTMLGMIIGNASVIAMVSVGQGTQNEIKKQFESLGTNILFIVPGVQQRGPQAGAVQANTLLLSDAEAIAKEVPAVSYVAPEKIERLRLVYGDRDTNVSVTGTTETYPQVRNSEVAKGRFFNTVEVESLSRVAVLGSETARQLFGTRSPLNEKIRIGDLSFQVIGVMAEKGAALGQNQDEVAFIPIVVMANQLSGRDNLNTSPTVQTISVSARDRSCSSAAQYQITNLLRLRHNILDGEDDFTVRNQQDLLKTANNVTNLLILVLGVTASISLIVGGIGIMNMMLVSVTERTKEIGLRKALGATGQDILIQFSIESILLSTTGGVLGIVLGVGGIVLVAAASPLSAIVSGNSILLAFSVSSSIGLIFGIIPARNAANLDPILALRSS